ncbi:MAG: UDP-N-acetylmuramoyl-tripeptide--D-alanyl-D-alanine ligase [Betaproteobacteria bacterium]
MMDTATAARAVAGRLYGESVRFGRVATDTRSLAPGDLFVALKGERFDGHDFVAAALEHGAAAAMVAADRARSLAGNLIAVADPLAALAVLAAYWRDQFALPVIVVVGSNGKTTVNQMLTAILRAHHGEAHVLATGGNFNNAIGLPLTLLGLRDEHAVAAIELGMNHRGETAELAAVAQPTIAVINNAQREHQEFMQSVAEVAAEHADLILALTADGIAVINADDAFVDVWRDAAHRKGVAVVEFGLDHPAAVRGRWAPTATGATLDVATPAGDATVHLSAPGRHNASNALAAATAALATGVPLPAVIRGLEAFRPVAGRLVPIAAASGARVIDDTYNANPDSVRAAIDVLATATAPRWLALGDMGEVGAHGPAYHREVGEHARRAGIERMLTTGTLAAEAAAAFGAGAEHFATVDALAAHVAANATAGVTVLVKGSRFMRMERVVAALAGDVAAGGKH